MKWAGSAQNVQLFWIAHHIPTCSCVRSSSWCCGGCIGHCCGCCSPGRIVWLHWRHTIAAAGVAARGQSVEPVMRNCVASTLYLICAGLGPEPSDIIIALTHRGIPFSTRVLHDVVPTAVYTAPLGLDFLPFYY